MLTGDYLGMTKGYVGNISSEKDSQGVRVLTHVDFASKKESAAFLADQTDAEDGAGMLEYHDIAITTAEGQRYLCKGYQVEERAPGAFVVWWALFSSD